jgi:hypothetical protein
MDRCPALHLGERNVTQGYQEEFKQTGLAEILPHILITIAYTLLPSNPASAQVPMKYT